MKFGEAHHRRCFFSYRVLELMALDQQEWLALVNPFLFLNKGSTHSALKEPMILVYKKAIMHE